MEGNKARMMKKRLYSIASMLMVLVFLLTGCSTNKKQSNPEQSAEETTASPEVESTQTEQKVIIKGTPLNENKSVYAIDEWIDKKGYTVDTLYFYDDHTLLVVLKDAKSKSYVYYYDIENGVLTGGTKIDHEAYMDQALFCDNGLILLGTSVANTFYYLDKELSVLFESSQLTDGYSSMAGSKEGTYFYYLDSKDKNLYQYMLETQESKLIMKLDKSYENISIREVTANGKYIVASYSDSKGNLETCLIDPDKKIITAMDGVGSNIVTGQDNIYLMDSEKTSDGFLEYFAINNPRVLHKFYFDNKIEGMNFYIDGEDGNLLSIKNNIDKSDEPTLLTFQLYDLNKGFLTRSASIERQELFSYVGYKEKDADPVNDWFFYSPGYYGFSPNHKIAYFTYFIDNKTRVMLWDMTKENEIAMTQSGTAFYTDTDISEEDNDTYVEELNKKYGVTIYIRNNVVKFFPDFAVNALYNEETTNSALKEVEKLLSRFPTGFFKDLKYGSIKGLEIYLCGALVQGSDNGIQNPGGFALQYKGKQMIVMDATYPQGLVQSISHEIMHAVDSKLEYMVDRGKVGKGIYTKWLTLNPKKYDYKYSYVDKEGVEYNAFNNAKYTPTDEKSLDDVNNIYFIDYYANTFPIEDRARIFEYLMTADNELSYEFNSKHLKKKADLLCEMIRVAMPSIPENEVMYWEKYLKANK